MKLIFFFFTIKFQGCGSEHNHGLIWIKDVSIYKVNSSVKIETFIDKYISRDKPTLIAISFT